MQNRKGLDIFNLVFDNIFWENIVKETNRYAEQILNNENERRKINESWFSVDCNEIKIFRTMYNNG